MDSIVKICHLRLSNHISHGVGNLLVILFDDILASLSSPFLFFSIFLSYVETLAYRTEPLQKLNQKAELLQIAVIFAETLDTQKDSSAIRLNSE
jgi:hypothetical protein